MLSRMFTLVLLAFSLQSLAQTSTTTYNKNETAIRALLAAQTKAWNEGNLVDFMEGYLPFYLLAKAVLLTDLIIHLTIIKKATPIRLQWVN
jgi:hypothetical protein